MKRFLYSPWRSRNRPDDASIDLKLVNLLKQVWDLDVNKFSALGRHSASKSYSAHFLNCYLADELPEKTSEAITLVNIVKKHSELKLSEVRQIICQEKSTWNDLEIKSHEDADRAVIGAVRLWLFTVVNTENCHETITQLVRDSLPKIGRLDVDELPDDFSAKTLQRVAGFSFEWTSDMGEHLNMVGDRIKFFRHTGAVQRLLALKYSDIYPRGFLEELALSIRLFFPVEGVRTRRRTRRIEQKHEVDLEVGLRDELLERRLENYPYFGDKLRVIWRNYDRSEPRRLKQWWFDRRRKYQWVGLVVAIVSFVVTAIFTIISAVTGIVDVWQESRL